MTFIEHDVYVAGRGLRGLTHTSYYEGCKVSNCAYTIIQHSEVLDIASKLLGLCEYYSIYLFEFRILVYT